MFQHPSSVVGDGKNGKGCQTAMTYPNRISRFASLALIFLSCGLPACTTQEAASPQATPVTVTSVPPQRSYLDAGPIPSTGGANYTRPGVGSSARQTDFFGNDVVPRMP